MQSLQNIRDRATRAIECTFQTSISINGGEPIAAARWNSIDSATEGLAGLLPGFDARYRVRRSLLTDVTIIPEQTILVEAGVSYRVSKVGDANGDPCLVLECKAL